MTAVRLLIVAALAALVSVVVGTPVQAAAEGPPERAGSLAVTGRLLAVGGQGDDGTGGTGDGSIATPTPTAGATPSAVQPTPTPTPKPSATPTSSPPAAEPIPEGRNDEGGLPVTGAQVGGMTVLGAGLLAAGIALLAVRRRRDLSDLLGS